MEILQIKNLNFQYNEAPKYALKDISLTVNEGEFVVICGESGCGKSTLLKLLKKETSPFGKMSGEIIYDGKDRNELDKRVSASEIGFVLQNPESQIVTDYVWHELAFGLESLGLDSQEIRRRTAEMASYFGIQEWFHKKTNELSGGEKQILNLASIMVMQPKVLLLDEPTAQLDPIAASDFIDTLARLNYELGITVILVEHRLEEIFPIADRVIIMDSGAISYDGKPELTTEFFKENPEHPMRKSLPAAMRIFEILENSGASPITVRDGRSYIRNNYSNKIKKHNGYLSVFSEEVVVELKNVYFRYERNSNDILKGVSLKVFKGEHHCILGGNGTGKTTTLNAVAGLLKPYRGDVVINRKPLRAYKGNSLYINGIALLTQDPQTLFIGMTVKEDLEEICKAHKYGKRETEEKINDVAEMLSISHLLLSHPYDLSGGEQQKAGLAKVLLTNPTVLLLDEPTKGIDANAKAKLVDIISRLKQEGMTVVTVTHDIEFAATSADKCSLFFDGAIVSSDIPVRFFCNNSYYTTSANRIAKGFFEDAYLCEHIAELCLLNGKAGDKL